MHRTSTNLALVALLATLVACGDSPAELVADSGPFDRSGGDAARDAGVEPADDAGLERTRDAEPSDAARADAARADAAQVDSGAGLHDLSCNSEDIAVPPPSSDAGLSPVDAGRPEGPIAYALACPGIVAAPDPGCDVPAEATLELGSSTFELTRACFGGFTVEDEEGAYEGVRVALGPEDRCAPLIELAILDLERHPELPATIDLEERLCPGSILHNVAVVVQTDEDCMMLESPNEGTLELQAASADEWRGSLETTLVRQDGGDAVPVALELRFGPTFEGVNVSALYDDLCVADGP